MKADTSPAPPPSDRGGAWFMLGAAVCWSLGGLCIKFIPWSALSIVGLRALLAAAVFIAYRRNARVRCTLGTVLGALCLSGTTLLYVFANKLTTAAAAILLQYTAPVFIVLYELIFARKKPKRSDILAVGLTLGAMTLFFFGRTGGSGALGNLLAIASGAAFAGVFVCNRRADVRPGDPTLLGFYINCLIGLPFAFLDRSVTADASAWSAMLVLGVVQVGVAYMLFTPGIKKTPALLACLITAAEPVLNPVWVALFTGEVPGLFTVLGGIGIVVTVVGYNVWTRREVKAVGDVETR